MLLNSLNICLIINRQSLRSCPIKKRQDGSHWDDYQPECRASLTPAVVNPPPPPLPTVGGGKLPS